MLRVDPYNSKAQALAKRLEKELDKSLLPEDLCLSIGGDGWMLSCIREMGPRMTYLGLNTGHLGFLLNDVEDLGVVVQQLHQGRWTATPFPRLGMEAVTTDGKVQYARAVNDLYAERSTGQTAHLRVQIDGEIVVDRLVCDGLLTSTALGSTAYSYSAGGVPTHPMVRAVQITPVCPHAPRLSPFLLPENVLIEIDVLETHRRPVRAVADGLDIGPMIQMRIQVEDEIKLAFLEGHHYTRTLISKVLKS
jgi:NAD+ kinase